VIDLAPLLRIGLVLVRSGVVVMTLPLFGSVYAPPTVKVGLVLLLSLALAPLVTVPGGLTTASLVMIIAREVGIGVALSMAVRLLLAGAELGGHLVGLQMGFSYVSVIDPSSGARNQMMSTLYANMTIMALFATNGHHAVLRALANSYRTLPVAVAAGVSADLVQASARMLGLVLVLGVQLAAPIVTALILVEVALGVLSRSVPALNVGSIGYSVRLVVGLLMLGSALAAIPTVTNGLLREAFDVSEQAARALR
jgi:flagellar biosynthetic protein FliR